MGRENKTCMTVRGRVEADRGREWLGGFVSRLVVGVGGLAGLCQRSRLAVDKSGRVCEQLAGWVQGRGQVWPQAWVAVSVVSIPWTRLAIDGLTAGVDFLTYSRTPS